ncbi:ASCH domain-containing protein [Pseudomonas sp. NPDC090208]|uniref:ASCH domain-containing protein n=1 Tax=Pseudomonas sp. NPDC090208 TaxID=3364478 RepID=UPI0037F96006
MKALSIRQPWAWLIVHGGKDVENRSWKWHPKFRGRFLVHAAQGMTKDEYAEAAEFASSLGVTVPPADQLLRGGVIGSVVLADSQDTSQSPWYMGQKALVLREPLALPFIRIKGQLGFFEIPNEQLVQLSKETA